MLHQLFSRQVGWSGLRAWGILDVYSMFNSLPSVVCLKHAVTAFSALCHVTLFEALQQYTHRDTSGDDNNNNNDDADEHAKHTCCGRRSIHLPMLSCFALLEETPCLIHFEKATFTCAKTAHFGPIVPTLAAMYAHIYIYICLFIYLLIYLFTDA